MLTIKSTVACNSCILQFDTPKKTKNHIINNLNFCYQCRTVFRKFWQDLILGCKDELKKEFDKNYSEDGALVKEYFKIIDTHIEECYNNKLLLPLCPNKYKPTLYDKICPYEFAWQQRCQWCVSKRMLPLVNKFPMVKYCHNAYKQDYSFWQKLSAVNESVRQSFVEKYISANTNEEKISHLENRNHQVTSASPISIISKNNLSNSIARLSDNNTQQLQQSTQIYKILRQIHQDQMNSCFYLDGMFENAKYYSKKSIGCQAQELISIKTKLGETTADEISKTMMISLQIKSKDQTSPATEHSEQRKSNLIESDIDLLNVFFRSQFMENDYLINFNSDRESFCQKKLKSKPSKQLLIFAQIMSDQIKKTDPPFLMNNSNSK